jgi:rRNA maturation protein Rpf1
VVLKYSEVKLISEILQEGPKYKISEGGLRRGVKIFRSEVNFRIFPKFAKFCKRVQSIKFPRVGNFSEEVKGG